MKWLTAILCLTAIVLCAGDAIADRCSDISPVVFCDDFDRWCEEPPVDPNAACPLGRPEDNDAFRAYWPQSDGICSSDVPYSLSTVNMWKPDGYVVYAPQNQSSEKLARHVHDMTPEILAHDDNQVNQYGGINGSGEILPSTDPSYVDPSTIDTMLKGQFFVHMADQYCAYSNFIFYAELYLGDDRAPTNFVRVNCYPEAQGPYQVLQTTDGEVHASFAFGLMSILDNSNNPCDVDMGRKPTAWRAFVYDGLTWTRLKAPAFGLPLPDIADFRPWSGEYNRFEFYIGSDYIEIRLYNRRAEMLNDTEGTCVHHPRRSRCYGGANNDSDCETDADCAPISTGLCVSGTCTNLGSCTNIGSCNLETSECEGGSNDGEPCSTDADCPDSCEGGSNDGLSCSTDDDCPDSCERGLYEYEECSTDADCDTLACWGGILHGIPCSTDDDCPGGPPLVAQPYFVARVPRQYTGPFNKIAMGAGKGVDLTVPACELVGPAPIIYECVGGINSATSNFNGADHPCATVDDCPPSQGSCVSSVCVGGANHDGACTRTCPGGLCDAQGQCDGGTNDGQPCDCPAYEECLEPLSWEDNAYMMKADEVVVYDGVFAPVPASQGACCRGDTGTCEENVQEANCTTPDLWYDGQVCNDIPVCCPVPWADIDRDNDVDQKDFGQWQVCFTGDNGGVNTGCECYDRNDSTGAQGGDGNDIDSTDFIWFTNCFTGSTVPLNVNNPPAGCTP